MTSTRVRPPKSPVDPAADLSAVRLLTPDGERVSDPVYASSLDDDAIRQGYREMLLARRIDTEATNLQRQGQLSLWAPMLGQEGAQIGAVHALRDTDLIYPSYREIAMAMARGLDPVEILRVFRGVSHIGWDIDEYRFGLYNFVVGAQTLQATGHAMGIALDGADEVVLCCLGDGATSEGHVSEALNFAAVFEAPVVFFVQNNQWAISVPNARQFKASPAQRAVGFGITGVRVDGNDLLAVQAVVSAAVERARGGDGPQLVEAYTYRLGAHTTADDPTRYRSREEEQAWAEQDPLLRVERWLRAAHTPESFFATLADEADAVAADVRARALALEGPVITDLYDQVLAEPSAALIDEREQVQRYLSALEGR